MEEEEKDKLGREVREDWMKLEGMEVSDTNIEELPIVSRAEVGEEQESLRVHQSSQGAPCHGLGFCYQMYLLHEKH